MNEPAIPGPAPEAPRRRRRILPLLVLALVALAAAAALVFGVSPALRWSARAHVAPAPREDAWRLVPADRPVIAALDVQALLGSAVAKEIRPELERLAASRGFDLGLTERNARLLLLSSDGRGFASGSASGPRLSPLLLPRFDPRWRATVAAGGPAVTDGSAVIKPMAPGLVAYAVSEAAQDATAELESALAQAGRASAPAQSLDSSTLLIVVTPDAALRRRMTSSVPREAVPHAAALERLEARAVASETLDADIRLTMATEDAAALLAGALAQLDQVLTSGVIAFLAPFLGESAAIIAKIPPFDVVREGRDVVVTMKATPEHLRGLLKELEKLG